MAGNGGPFGQPESDQQSSRENVTPFFEFSGHNWLSVSKNPTRAMVTRWKPEPLGGPLNGLVEGSQ
jgi:hypothetical protein